MLLGLRGSLLDSEESLRIYCDRFNKDTTLNKHIITIQKHLHLEIDQFQVLDHARQARNDIAHELTLGFEAWSTIDDAQTIFHQHLRSTVMAIAEGDRLISLLISLATKSPIPTSSAMRILPEQLLTWVLDGRHKENI